MRTVVSRQGGAIMKKLAAAIAVATAGVTTAVTAQDWPSRPIQVVVPYAPGGVTDLSARAVAQALSERLQQPVVVDNRPGAQGIVGVNHVKNATADGYTLAFVGSSAICVNQYVRESLPFDVKRDLEPVGIVGNAPLMMVVSPTLPVASVSEFLAYAKSHPGKVSFSSPGVGGSAHLYGAAMNKMAGVEMLHVPYKGGAPAMQAVLAGDVTMTFADLSFAESYVSSGRLAALAVSGAERWPSLSEVPTFKEADIPINLVGWVGIMAPKGTPASIIAQVSAALGEVANDEAAREQLRRLGVAPTSGTSEDMRQMVGEGCLSWGQAVREAGVEPE